MMKTLLLAVALASSFVTPHLTAQPGSPIFRFQPDGFWLNLHHFLYVLGRAEAKMPDMTRRAVVGAPADQAAGLTHLSETEREAWMAAVRSYAAGWSKKDTVFDADLVAVTTAVGQAGQERPASSAKIDAALAAVLDRVAPIYRKVWWPAHRQANLDQMAAMDPQHVPYAEGNGLWRQKGLGSFKPALDSAWKPYLDGKGTLDQALVALLRAQPPG